MCEKKADNYVSGFENLSENEQKEVVKKLLPRFCKIVMKEKDIMGEMMPRCMEMMKETGFPMKEMMSKMMGKGGEK